MAGSITLHPTLGVNPRLVEVHCAVCGREKSDSLVMLGNANYKVKCSKCGVWVFGGMGKVSSGYYKCPSCGEYHDSRRSGEVQQLTESERIHSDGVCSECQDFMKKGVVFISVLGDEGQKYRMWTCRNGHTFAALVILSENTPNLSGEAKTYCPQCGELGTQGSPVETFDAKNPYRTGGFCVLKEEAVRRMVQSAELCEQICRKRVCFIPDAVWDALGLPRGDVPEEEAEEVAEDD